MNYYFRRYLCSETVIGIILVLSFMPFPETSLDDVPMMDKWTHFVMYGGFTSVIWWEYLRCHHFIDRTRLFVGAFLLPSLMSGIIELLQEYCTTYRSGDWFDLLANIIGVSIGAGIGMLMQYFHFRRKMN